MKKTKQILLSIICAIIILVGIFAGCSNSGKTEETKYDVAIRIGCSDGNIYEFPVGNDELHIEIPYDGIERRYGVKAYNLPDHPRWSKEWFSPSGEGANVFDLSIAKENTGVVKSVCEKGLYCVNTYADSTSNIWKFRHVKLFITVI